MENKQPTGKYWFWCFVWTAIMAAMIIYVPVRQFFWLALPGACTYFAKAMNIIDADVKGR
jgi:hypothetical protein